MIRSVMPESLTMCLLERVANAKGADILELPPLGKTIDPEAIERLFDERAQSVALEFTYAECHISIAGGRDPHITVER